MTLYGVPVRQDVMATAYVEANSAQEAVERAAAGAVLGYHELSRKVVPSTGAVLLPDNAGGAMLAVLRQHTEQAQALATAVSQVADHPVLPLLDAVLVLLGATTRFHREDALVQAVGVLRRALGENPPVWAEMQALLREASAQLDALGSITVRLDDGSEADGQDWAATREEAEELAGRIHGLLDGLDLPSRVPTVRVDISGGVAALVAKPFGVAVEIRDYDVDGADPDGWDLHTDQPGSDPYSVEFVGPQEEVMG